MLKTITMIQKIVARDNNNDIKIVAKNNSNDMKNHYLRQ